MAGRAGLVFLVLVVRRTDGWLGSDIALRQRVALQAQEIDLTDLEQPRICGSVRRVAGRTAFRLDGYVLINERSALLGVTLEADLVLFRAGAQLVSDEAAVLVVAVGTLDQSLIHAVAVGTPELGAHLVVTLIAQRGRGCLQQVLLDFRGVNRVATGAANAVFQMGGAMEVAAVPGLMAG